MAATIKYKTWFKKVKESIAEDWLELIDDNTELRNQLRVILVSLYLTYHPKKDGTWSASPGWQDMFNWTSCPLEKVKAVILLKGPKAVTGRNSNFTSTGYGAGVQRKSGSTNGQGIYDIATVKSMLDVAHKCLQHPDDDLEALVEGKYQNGFNPEYLSRQGILFLNVALTSGHSDRKDSEDSDVKMWSYFTMGLLEAMPGLIIPLFQWYVTRDIMDTLSDLEYKATFAVSKPVDLDLGPMDPWFGPHKHICYLQKSQIGDYAMELATKKYRKHRAILGWIYRTMVCESKVQTYPAAKEEFRGTKRRAEYEEEDVPVSRMKWV